MKRKPAAKLICLLLVMTTLLGLVPMAFAEEVGGEAEPGYEEPTGEVAPGEAAEEPGEEPGEEAAEPSGEPEEEEEPPVEPGPVLVRFVSAQELTLTLTGEDGVLAPLHEEELAAFLDASTETAGEESGEAAFTAAYLLAPGLYIYTAEAEGFQPLRAELEVTEATAWGTTVPITLEAELPYDFKGMPDGYILSNQELSIKQRMAEHDVAAEAEKLVPGVDYVEDQVFFLADSEEYARMVAEAYNAELLSCSDGVAVLRLTTVTPLEAMRASQSLKLSLPPVELNYTMGVEPEYDVLPAPSGQYQTMSGETVNTLQSWEGWYHSLPTEQRDPYLRDPTQEEYQYFHDMINTYEAWGITRGAGVTVAVIDSGVAADHEDLAGAVTVLTIQDSLGVELTGISSPHGTHVAGIVAARMGNGLGGAGVAPEASLIAIRTDFTSAGTIRAYNRAAAEGADVLNLSLAGYLYSANEETALQTIIDDGVTVVAAMSNEGSNLKKYPAAHSIPGLIAVGAVDECGVRAPFSNSGPWEDVVAPGVDVMSTVPTGDGAYGSSAQYDFKSGTSMATPVVSGLCALYLSQYPDATPAQVEKAIKTNSASNRFVDAAKLFSIDKSAPTVYFSDLRSGKVSYGSAMVIQGCQDGDQIVYTVNGLKPSVKDGKVVWGTVYTGPVAITSENGFVAGKKTTVYALRVSGMGVVSKLASRTVTVDYAEPASVSVTNGPGTLVAGKSLTLKAQVWPLEARQEVTWALDPASPAGVKINAKTGALTTSKTSVGLVTVTVTSKADPSVSAQISFPVEGLEPVKKIQLNTGNSLDIELGTWGYPPQLIPTAYGASGAELPWTSFTYSSSKPKVADVDSDGTVRARRKGTTTITVRALDGSGVTAKCKVTVKQLVTELEIVGPSCVNRNKAISYTVKCAPNNANNKKVFWSVYPEPADNYYITINKNGKLIVPPDVPYGTQVQIIATSADGNAQAWFDVQIQPPATYVGKIEKDTPFFGGGGVIRDKDGSLKQVTLYTVELDYYDGDTSRMVDAEIQLRAATDCAGGLVWSSSNPKVATVDESGHVRAVSPGTATITAKANDGSGKKASLSVRVIIPASGVTITPAKAGNSATQFLAVGKSRKNYVRLSDAFGKPSVKTVYWDELQVEAENRTDGERDYDLEDEILDKKWLTLSSSGTLTASAKLAPYLDDYYIRVTVTVRTTDGTDLSDSVTYLITRLITELTLGSEDKNTVKLTAIGTNFESDVLYRVKSWYGSKPRTQLSWTYYHYLVESSNPWVASAYIVYDNSGKAYLQPVIGRETGTATITVTAADGSGQKATLKITVKNS